MADRPLLTNSLVRSLRDVVGVESWAAQTMEDGADSDGVENPDRRDGWGDPPATFEDSEPGNHDQVGDAPARVERIESPEPIAAPRPMRSMLRKASAEDTGGGVLLLARDANRYRAGVKVEGSVDAFLSSDPARLFDATTVGGSGTFRLEASDGVAWLHGGAEIHARGDGGTAVVNIIEELYAVGTRVPDAERPADTHE